MKMNIDNAAAKVKEFLNSMPSYVQEDMNKGIKKYGMAYLFATTISTVELLKKVFISMQKSQKTLLSTESPSYEGAKKFFEQQLFKLDVIEELSQELLTDNLKFAVESFIENGSYDKK